MPYTDDGFSPYATAKGTLYLITKSAVAGLSGSVFFILIARFLPTVSDLGFVNGLQALMTLMVILAGLGLPVGAARFISSHIGAGEENIAKRIHVLVFRIGLISSIALSLVLYFLASFVATLFFHNATYTHLIQLASIDVFLSSMISFSNYLLFALQKFRGVSFVSIVNSLLKFSVAFLLLILGMGLGGIIIGFIIGDAVAVALFVYILVPWIRKGTITINEIKPLFKFSLPLFGSFVLDFLSKNMDIYLILILTTLYTTGIYTPAVMLGAVLIMILGAMDQSFLPYFSRRFGKLGSKSLEEPLRFLSRYMFLIFLPLGFAISGCIPIFINDFLGERYAASIYPSMIIVLAITLTSMGTVYNNVLMSSGHSNIFLKSTGMALSVQAAVSLSMIPLFGGIGAASARALSFIILFVVPALKLRKTVVLSYDQIALQRGLIGSILMFSIIFTLSFYLKNVFYFPLILISGLMSYLLFLRFTKTVNTDDLDVIKNISSGRLTWMTKTLSRILIQ